MVKLSYPFMASASSIPFAGVGTLAHKVDLSAQSYFIGPPELGDFCSVLAVGGFTHITAGISGAVTG